MPPATPRGEAPAGSTSSGPPRSADWPVSREPFGREVDQRPLGNEPGRSVPHPAGAIQSPELTKTKICHRPGTGCYACCVVRGGSLLRPAAKLTGDAVRRGQVQAERTMKARSTTSTPMERP